MKRGKVLKKEKREHIHVPQITGYSHTWELKPTKNTQASTVDYLFFFTTENIMRHSGEGLRINTRQEVRLRDTRGKNQNQQETDRKGEPAPG